MNRLRQRITLLYLFDIYFIYKVIMAFIDENEFEIILWTVILIIYSISLLALYLAMKIRRSREIKIRNNKKT
ncbi:MAG: hypothetical protein BAJALOKI2v1_240035 [Promethearchaeota archaeon]|nr:MAG: hypothetical protein BAJALOKI2v1_240035 [Candidatus Lokiarchaeota archaeon]